MPSSRMNPTSRDQSSALSFKRRNIDCSQSQLLSRRRKLTMSSFLHVPLLSNVITNDELPSKENVQQQHVNCTNALIQIEMVARLNNMGCACLDGASSSDLPMAETYFRRALAKANDLMPFSPHHLHPETVPPLSECGVSKTSFYVYQRGEYDEGMHGFSDPVPLNADIVSAKTAVATLHFNVAQLQLRRNNDEEALQSFLRAMQVGQWDIDNDLGKQTSFSSINCTVTGGVSFVAVLHSIGHVQYRNGRYDDAIKTYTRALDICKTSFVQPDSSRLLELAGTLNCLGVCHFHLPQADTSKTLTYYTESLGLRRSVLGQDARTKEIATIFNNIGRVHYMLSDHDTALGFYSRALNMRRFLFGDDHLDVAATIFNAAQTFHHRTELDQAMELYKEFLKIAKNHLGYHHRDVAAMLKCMAQIKHECKEVEAAAKLYREAIDVGRAALGDHHPEVAATLNKLGNLLYENNDLDSAVKVYREGLEVERVVLDHDHPNIVVTITNIAQIYKLQEKYELALGLYKDAVAIQRRSLDPSHTNISCTLSSIALIHYRTRRFTQALEVYQDALRIRRDAYGDDHVEVASTLNSVGLVLFKMDLHDFALQSFNESLRIRRELLGPDHRDVAVVLYNLATCCLEVGQDDKAMFYYRETLRVEKAALGENHRDVILTLLHCGQVLQGRGELNEALEYYAQALEAQGKGSTTNTSDHATAARILNHMGNIFLQRGQAREMVESLSNSLRRLRAADKKENELVVSGFNFYAIAKRHPEASSAA